MGDLIMQKLQEKQVDNQACATPALHLLGFAFFVRQAEHKIKIQQALQARIS